MTLLSGPATASDSDPKEAGRPPALTTAPATATNLASPLPRKHKVAATPLARVARLATKSIVEIAAASHGAERCSLSTLWPRESTAPSGDACGASRRQLLPAARQALLLAPTAWITVGRGFGTPAAGQIRCTRGSAAAHRDPVLLLCSVVPLRIAMGTSYGADAKRCAAVVPAGRHSAATRGTNGRAAGGGHLSPRASATPPSVAGR